MDLDIKYQKYLEEWRNRFKDELVELEDLEFGDIFEGKPIYGIRRCYMRLMLMEENIQCVDVKHFGSNWDDESPYSYFERKELVRPLDLSVRLCNEFDSLWPD